MLKKELIQLLENIKDDQDVSETILNIEDFAKSSSPNYEELTLDGFKDLIKNNKTVGGYYQAMADRRVTDALKTFEKDTLPGKVEEEIIKRNNVNKTPEQIELEKQMKENQKLINDINKAKLESKFKDVLTEKKIDTRLLPFIMSENEEMTNQNIETISEILAAEKAAAIKAELKETTYIPGKSTSGNSGGISWNDVIQDPSLMKSYQEQQNKK